MTDRSICASHHMTRLIMPLFRSVLLSRSIIYLSLFAAVVLSGCATTMSREPKASRLTFSAVGAANLNPDSSGNASPLVIRIYALRDLTEFNVADYFALYDRDEEVLAQDLVKRDEIIIEPGQTLTLDREFPPEMRFVGVLAAFREVGQAKWRASTDIWPGTNGVLIIRADDDAISLELEPSK